MQEAWRTYLGMALGLGETSRKRVRKVVKEAVGKGNATADQVKTMTSDLLAANTANREALAKLVKFEVDRALGRVGLATVDEVRDLTDRVHELERELRQAQSAPAGSRKAPGRPAADVRAGATAPTKAATRTATRKATKAAATKAAATKTAAKSSSAVPAGKATKSAAAKKATRTVLAKKTAAATTAAAKRTTARTTTARTTAARTTAAPKRPAAKSTAPKSTVRKSTVRKSTAAKKTAKAAR